MRGGKLLFSGLNFELKPGQAIGLSGPNGAGKSSLILSILDLLPFSGRITKGFSAAELGVVWQDRGLPLNVTPKRWFSYLSDLYQQPFDETLALRLNFEMQNKPVRSFSGGEQQKIAVISAFFHKPNFLILDEPTVGLDAQNRTEFYEICREAIRGGASILITSHLGQDLNAIVGERIHLGEKHTEKLFQVSFSRKLSSEQIQSVQQLANLISINEQDNGYLLEAEKNPLPFLSDFSASLGIEITSFGELQ